MTMIHTNPDNLENPAAVEIEAEVDRLLGAVFAVAPRKAKPVLGGQNRIYRLLNSGEIESYVQGRSRLIVVASIKRYLIRQLATAKPPSGTPHHRHRHGK